MDFGEALKVLKTGGKVSRAGWNGKGMYLFLIYGDETGSLPVSDCIAMKTADNRVQPGWLASQTDMLADDWQEA